MRIHGKQGRNLKSARMNCSGAIYSHGRYGADCWDVGMIPTLAPTAGGMDAVHDITSGVGFTWRDSSNIVHSCSLITIKPAAKSSFSHVAGSKRLSGCRQDKSESTRRMEQQQTRLPPGDPPNQLFFEDLRAETCMWLSARRLRILEICGITDVA